MSESKNIIFGREFNVSSEQNAYNELRTEYLELSKSAKKELSEWYDENVSEINDLFSKLGKQVETIIDKYENKAVLDLIELGIYDIDEVRFNEMALNGCGKLREAYSATVGKFKKIDAEQTKLDAESERELANIASNYRENAVNTIDESYQISTFFGGRGGLAGVYDAASDSSDELVSEAVAAGAKALLTKGVRHFEKKAAEDEKENIFKSVSTKQDMLNGVEDDVFSFHKAIADIVNTVRGTTIYRYASDEELEKAEPVCRNIIRGNFKDELEKAKITEFMILNPYEFRIYVYLCKKSGSFTHETDALVSYYNIDREKLADTFAREKFSLSDCTEYEDAVTLEENVRNEIKIFGVEECNFLYEVIDLRDRLYIERRTFRGYVYDTIEDRDNAEKQYNDFFEEHQNIGDMDIDELFECYAATCPSEIYPKNKAEFRSVLIKNIKKYVNVFDNIDDVIVYIDRAEKMKEVYPNDTDTELTDLLNSRKKRIENKEKIRGFMGSAKEKAMGVIDKASVGNIKEKMNEKFGSAEGNVNSSVKNIGEKAQNTFGGIADKFRRPAVQQTEQQFEQPMVQPAAQPAHQVGKICPSCGTPDTKGGRFCVACGYRIDNI